MSEKKCPHCNKVAMEYNHWFKADVCKICGYRDPPIITNFDRIRSMNDEELAKYLFDCGNGSEYCYGHCAYQDDCRTPLSDDGCLQGVIKWGKQPYTEESK